VQEIAAAEAVRDIVIGATDAELMAKYGLSQDELFSLFDRLVNTKYITRAEIGGRRGAPQRAAREALSRGALVRIILAGILLASPLVVLVILPLFIGFVPFPLLMMSGGFAFPGGILLRTALPNRTAWRWIFTVLGSGSLGGSISGFALQQGNPFLGLLIGIPFLVAGMRTSIVVTKGTRVVRCPSCGGETPVGSPACFQCKQLLE